MKKNYLLAITLVIAGLLITSATSMAIQNQIQEEEQEFVAEFLWMPAVFVKPVTTKSASNPFAPLRAGSQITGGDYDEYRPSIAAGASNQLFAAFEGSDDGVVYYPIFTFSLDNGMNWDDAGYFPDSAGATKPVVDYKTGGFYASFEPSPDTNGQIWIVDARNVNNIEAAYWDFSAYSIEDFKNIDIGTYTNEGPNQDPGVWNWGGLAMTGYNGYSGNNIYGCPYVFYQYSEAGGGMIGWLNNADGCVRASMDIDQDTKMSYEVYDRLVTGKFQLLVRKDNFGVWNPSGAGFSHPMVTTKTITSTGNLTYPDVIADQNTVLIVAQDNQAGNEDIICYYSSNGMTSYSSVVIANSAEDELYPQLTWIKSGVAVCTYIRGSEAYFRATEDGGVTWSAEARVSDEQISPVGDHAMTISGLTGKAFAIWQDGRGSNVDIYFDQFFEVAAPNVQIGTVSGGIGKVTMEIQNIGSAPATDVAWSISVKGGLLGRINVTTGDVISTLAAGSSQTVSTDKFIFGFGTINVQLNAGDATATKTGRQLLIFTQI